jgi:hypothetical protein
MGWDDVQGIVRHILTTGAGVVVADGYATSDQATAIIGGLMALIGIAWSLWNKQNHRTALAAAKGSA